MRILWLRAPPWAASGYGVQTALFVPKLIEAGHEVAICALGLRFGMMTWRDILCYPAGNHPYGSDVIAAHSAHWQADVCITLHDSWIFEPAQFTSSVRWVPWFPVDTEPLAPPVRARLQSAFVPIAISRFGEAMCKDAGLRAAYVPHGVDTDKYSPRDWKESRESLGIADDRFVVGMVGANYGYPSRKSLPQALEAFARFRERHDDALLYLHTQRGDEPWAVSPAVNLPALVEHLGITASVLVADSYDNFIGLSEDYMSRVYSACDCLLSPSMGEGFGVPILEAQACGCPVIVGDWTSMSELCFAGIKIPREQSEPFWIALNAYQRLPRIDGIVEALEKMYAEHRSDERLRATAREAVIEYDAARIAERSWKPVLADIQARLAAAPRPSRHGQPPRLHGLTRSAPPGDLDERLLMELSRDWTERTGYFGAALCALYGMAVGLGATRMLEVGVCQGGSTRAFLLAARRTGGHLWSIDIGDRTESIPEELREWWTLIVSRSQDVLWDRELDLLFLDGEHTHDATAGELRELGRWVRPGGLIIMDDVWDVFPGVQQAFEEYPLASERFYLPYGVAEAQSGGRERTMGDHSLVERHEALDVAHGGEDADCGIRAHAFLMTRELDRAAGAPRDRGERLARRHAGRAR